MLNCFTFNNPPVDTKSNKLYFINLLSICLNPFYVHTVCELNVTYVDWTFMQDICPCVTRQILQINTIRGSDSIIVLYIMYIKQNYM